MGVRQPRESVLFQPVGGHQGLNSDHQAWQQWPLHLTVLKDLFLILHLFVEKVKKFLQEFYYDDELGKKQFKYGTQLVSPRIGYGELGWYVRTCTRWPTLFVESLHFSFGFCLFLNCLSCVYLCMCGGPFSHHVGSGV